MEKNEIKEALGSNRVIEMETKKLDGPLTYLNLLRKVHARMSTTVGRPTDIKDTRYHNIPLTDETWEQLKEKARMIPGKKTISASHLATFLIEEGLKKLDEEIEKYDLGKIAK
ncbi:MAG: hypothetical protein AB1390_09295 [Nitrospirota bacterium]